jgi:DNA repair protein RecO
MPNKHIKDEIIILKSVTIEEHDSLVNVFARMHGKIMIKAKGSKKITSKFTGRLEPLSLISAEIYDSGRSFTLTGIRKIQNHTSLMRLLNEKLTGRRSQS